MPWSLPFLGFASHRLLFPNGDLAAQGRKVGFCLEDISRWSLSGAPKDRYTCGYQGIHAGWSDDYNSGLEGWWVDITDVLPGDYVLEDTINPDRIVP